MKKRYLHSLSNFNITRNLNMFKRKPIITAIALTMSATIKADLTTGLVAYYPFTGNAND